LAPAAHCPCTTLVRSTLLGPPALTDRVERGQARHVVARSADAGKFADVPGDYTRIAVGEQVEGWASYAEAYDADADFTPDGPTQDRKGTRLNSSHVNL